MTTTIDFADEARTGWTVAALIGNRIVSFHQFDVGSAAELTGAEVWAKKKELADLAEMKAAEEIFFAMPEDAEAEELDTACPRVVFGMVSGGRFTFNLSKGDAAKAGATHLA